MIQWSTSLCLLWIKILDIWSDLDTTLYIWMEPRGITYRVNTQKEVEMDSHMFFPAAVFPEYPTEVNQQLTTPLRPLYEFLKFANHYHTLYWDETCHRLQTNADEELYLVTSRLPWSDWPRCFPQWQVDIPTLELLPLWLDLCVGNGWVTVERRPQGLHWATQGDTLHMNIQTNWGGGIPSNHHFNSTMEEHRFPLKYLKMLYSLVMTTARIQLSGAPDHFSVTCTVHKQCQFRLSLAV